jgi:hypothetical protein
MTTVAELDLLIEKLTIDAYGDEEHLEGFLVGAEEALIREERATIVSATVEVIGVDCGPDARTGLTARAVRDGVKHEVSLADLTFAPGSELGVVVAAYRRWQDDESTARDLLGVGAVARSREGRHPR